MDTQTQFARELDLELERFARNLKEAGVLVSPFLADIDSTRSQVFAKNWTIDERRELENTPALLMINVDFDDFDPQKHSWFLLNFGARMHEGVPGVYHFREVLQKLATAVHVADIDVFEAARKIKKEVPLSEVTQIITAKPGAFGFSIDLIKAYELLKRALRNHLHY